MAFGEMNVGVQILVWSIILQEMNGCIIGLKDMRVTHEGQGNVVGNQARGIDLGEPLPFRGKCNSGESKSESD